MHLGLRPFALGGGRKIGRKGPAPCARAILPLPFWCWFEVFPMQLAVEFVVIVRIIQLCLYRIEKKYVGNLQGKEQSITLA
jgi:hypothetical protein